MRKTGSIDFYFSLIALVAIIFKLLGFIALSWAELLAYASMFWGMSVFYNSYLRQYQFGIFSGASFFLIGVTFISSVWFELYQPAKVLIPILLTIIGISFLISNLIGKKNKFILVLSAVFIVMGISLIISRGDSTLMLFLQSLYQMLKMFWWIILILAAVIFLAITQFKREKKNPD